MYRISGEIGRSELDLKTNHLLFLEYECDENEHMGTFGGPNMQTLALFHVCHH